jgi:hypothetical protein
MLCNRRRERVRDWISRFRVRGSKVDGIPPPLQADLANHRLGYHRRNMVELGVERIKRKKAHSGWSGGEQCAPIPVSVALLHKRCSGRVFQSPLVLVTGRWHYALPCSFARAKGCSCIIELLQGPGSSSRQEAGKKEPRFADENIISTACRTRVHHFKSKAAPVNFAPESGRGKKEFGSGPKKQEIGMAAFVFVEKAQEFSFVDANPAEAPTVDTLGRNKKSASMDFAPELEAKASEGRYWRYITEVVE